MFNFTRGSKERTTIGIDDKKNAKKCVRPCTGACVYVITLYRVDREREREGECLVRSGLSQFLTIFRY